MKVELMSMIGILTIVAIALGYLDNVKGDR